MFFVQLFLEYSHFWWPGAIRTLYLKRQYNWLTKNRLLLVESIAVKLILLRKMYSAVSIAGASTIF
jgi:hypothetical protein